MKKNNNKGFTLAELLIVVAIIAVLVAIAIPVFTTQLEKSREATDLSNIRAAYAEAMADYLTNGASASTSASGTLKQTSNSWQTSGINMYARVNGSESSVDLGTPTALAPFTVTVTESGSVTVSYGAGS